VNNGRLLIADFGLSKQLIETTSSSVANITGMIEYTEPQCYKNMNYPKDKRSDIYSLGVLFWEIASGRPPYSNRDDKSIYALCHHISSGKREEPIEDTPPAYQELYQRCWDNNPKSRPSIDEVYEEIRSKFNVNDINHTDEQDLVPSLNNYPSIRTGQSEFYL
jgi:serine/threonine protein kinase